MEAPRPGVAVRWTIAACISGGGTYLLAKQIGGDDGNWLSVFAKSLYGLAALMTGILLASPEAVLWAVSPIHRVLDSLFMPSESGTPPVDFTLARFYGQRMRYEEACVEYANILRYHPEQKLAYLEGIQAAGRAGNEEAVRRFHRGAKRWMCTHDERALLENVYQARHVPPILLDSDGGVVVEPNLL